jgi:hypothetical protein
MGRSPRKEPLPWSQEVAEERRAVKKKIIEEFKDMTQFAQAFDLMGERYRLYQILSGADQGDDKPVNRAILNVIDRYLQGSAK